MRSSRQLSITLPDELADKVRAKVASGEYASESEVIRDSLRVLLEREQSIESWLATDVADAYDALKASPDRGIPVAAVRDRLAALHRENVSRKP